MPQDGRPDHCAVCGNPAAKHRAPSPDDQVCRTCGLLGAALGGHRELVCNCPETPGAPHPGWHTRTEHEAAAHDAVNHPRHYTAHPSGVECIAITEHFNFCLGNAVKYIWRAGLKGSEIEDLKKARWYLDREIARREAEVRRG